MSKHVSFLSLLLLILIGGHFSGIFAAEHKLATADMYKQVGLAWNSLGDVSGESPLIPEPEFRRKGAPSRIIDLAPDGADIVIPGGKGQFTDLCGGEGCLAVAYGRDGKPAWKVPFNANAINKAPHLAKGQTEYLGQDFGADMSIAGIRSFADGDLLVTFNLANAFPYSFGIMRVGRDGTIRWRRADLSNHRANIGEDGNIYTPLHVIRTEHAYRESPAALRSYVRCAAPEKQYADLVQVVSPQGKELRRIDLIPLLLKDPVWASHLARTLDPCDPLHLNSVDVASAEMAASIAGVEKGDLLLSLRALSAVAILSADGKRIKRLVSGSFTVQHSAEFLGNDEIILFDNMGGSPGQLPSRVLAVSLVSGAERVIYARKPEDAAKPAEYSPTASDIALSDDHTRALVAFTRSGRMIELDLATGEVMSRYDNTQGKDGGVYKLYATTYAPMTAAP